MKKTPEQTRADHAAYMRKWNAANPDKGREYKQRRAARRAVDPLEAARFREQRRLSQARLRAADPQLRLKDALRSRLRMAFHGYKDGSRKDGSGVRDLGCSLGELRVHLEKQFTEGMTWDNYGLWHVDHIKALANFDLTDRDQLLEACNYKNLQPLWAADNRKKGSN